MKTVAEALRLGAERLARAGVADPLWDAERLLRHVLSVDRAALVATSADALPPESESRYRELIQQRAARRPLQHLLGVQAFWRHEFLVTPDVLIPRPETELLVEAALEGVEAVGRPVIVDVGTGSGCIALSLAAERPEAVVQATDISAAALRVAEENARRLGLQGRVVFHRGDLLAPVRPLFGRIDLVVSNPPYVAAAELSGLMPEVRDHEPRLALLPPDGPAAFYARLFGEARETLRPGGLVMVELGRGLDQVVSEVAERAGLEVEQVLPDLQSIPRVLVARRAMPPGAPSRGR
jgi:release factor glutamine methyltransferase